MHSLRGFLRARDGAAAIEFAIVAVPLILLIFGTIEMGRMFFTQQALQEVAISGARCAAVPHPSCRIDGVVSADQTVTVVRRAAAIKGLAVSSGDIDVDLNAQCSGISGFVRVSLNYTFQSAVSGLVDSLAIAPVLTASACFPRQPTV